MNKKQPVSKTKGVLRVGFDLDGVILYNPARIARPIIAFIKKFLLKKGGLRFYCPQSPVEKLIWRLLHWSSFIVAPGFSELKTLAQSGEIEVYIITARFDFLKDDFHWWMNRLKTNRSFKGCFYNDSNEQPHCFKERMIKKLELDIFVEDNWDIVNYLNSHGKIKGANRKILWVYNVFDRNITYGYKFPHLRQVIEFVRRIK